MNTSYKITPKKSLGQNFLIDDNIAKKIVASLNIVPGDQIIEIGPGTGALTKYLVDFDIKLILIEIDHRAYEELSLLYSNKENVFIHEIDFLKFNLAQFSNQKIKVIGNFPYYISSQIIFKLFENSDGIHSFVGMFQKEFAQRLNAKISTKDRGILSIASELKGQATKLFNVPPQCFFPQPKVTSQVIKFEFSDRFSHSDYIKVMPLVKICFNQRRKMLSNSIKNYINSTYPKFSYNQFLGQCDSDMLAFLKRRPEELLTEEFILLHNSIHSSYNNTIDTD